MTSGVSVSATGLEKKLGANQALAGLSLELAPGLLHGLIGPDGAGKTTFLRTVIGLLHPDAGGLAYRRDDEPVPLAAVRPQIAYMPQQQSLYADLSIDEHLAFFRVLYGLDESVYRARREELLRITRLDKFTDRAAGHLSGGMYKKLGLMCALLASPRLLLLDEPTNGVDPISRREFWDLLYRLREQSITIVVATAYMDEAERCDRVNLINEGRLLASGEPRDVLHREKASHFDELFVRLAEARR